MEVAPMRTITPAAHTLVPASPMSASTAAKPASKYLDNSQAAAFLNLSPRTLEKHRVLGGGPRFRKFGRRVMYAVVDLEAWADSRSFEMTSDPEYLSTQAAARSRAR
jgi:hypothetical protein